MSINKSAILSMDQRTPKILEMRSNYKIGLRNFKIDKLMDRFVSITLENNTKIYKVNFVNDKNAIHSYRAPVW